MSQLLRGRGEADSDPSGLLSRDISIGLEHSEDQVPDNLCRNIWSEESRRDRLRGGKASVDSRPAAKLNHPIFLAWPVRDGDADFLSRRLDVASERSDDPGHILMQCRLAVDEVNWRLSADITITHQITEQPRMIRRYRLIRSELQAPPGPGHPMATLEVACSTPSTLSQDLVVGRHPQLGAVAKLQPDDVLHTLVEPRR